MGSPYHLLVRRFFRDTIQLLHPFKNAKVPAL
jgi:hypothetical protein